MAELPKLKSADYFADEELKNAVHRIEVGRALSRETTGGRAHSITWAWAFSTLDYDAGYEANLEAVTRDGIARVCSTGGCLASRSCSARWRRRSSSRVA